MAKIGVLILNQNGRDWLATVYSSIFAQGFSQVFVYLVDNDSSDDSVALTRERFPQITVIRMPRNLGYCMAYNLAMPFAFADGCDWVVWANNDIKLEPDCLRELIRVATSDPRIGIVGPAFLGWESNEPNHYILGNHPLAVPAMRSRSPEPIDVEWVEGSFLMVSRRCVETVGPLDPYLFFYWEETDFCRRARFQGWRVVLVPRALARHYAGGWSDGDRQNTATRNWLQTRNYYVYHLANPLQGFARNIVDTVHLLCVKTKAHLREEPVSTYFELRVFFNLVRQARTIHKKWQRDRNRGHPRVVTRDLESVATDIVYMPGAR